MTTTVETTDTLVASEVFGPTIQGEGPNVGRRAGFIRLGGCNLACSWCDTPYSWDGSRFDLRSELERRPVADLAARALAGAPDLVVITGGEPMLHQQQPGWPRLLDAVTGHAAVEIETNGTITPTRETLSRPVRFNVSPKLGHSGDPEFARIKPLRLAAFALTRRAVFKFVCRDAGDVIDVAGIVDECDLDPATVWISPEGTDPETVIQHHRATADTAIDYGFNISTRLHVLLWGNERAR